MKINRKVGLENDIYEPNNIPEVGVQRSGTTGMCQLLVRLFLVIVHISPLALQTLRVFVFCARACAFFLFTFGSMMNYGLPATAPYSHPTQNMLMVHSAVPLASSAQVRILFMKSSGNITVLVVLIVSFLL